MLNRPHLGLITLEKHNAFCEWPLFTLKAYLKGDKMKEEWRPVVGYEGLYEVSNLGRVKSLARYILTARNITRVVNSRILKQSKTGLSKKYFVVCLGKNGVLKMFRVHRLVASSFLGMCPKNLVVDHIDNNPFNNRVDNLQYITIRENCSKDNIGSSSYTGVHWNKRSKKWTSGIVINQKKVHLGTFLNEKDASEAYFNKLREVMNEQG